MDTVWILGDQLHVGVSSLAARRPDDTRILLVEAHTRLASKRWHRQRARADHGLAALDEATS